VSIDERLGLQRGNWQYEFAKAIPLEASLSIFGDLTTRFP
jgi:hypothetical protein